MLTDTQRKHIHDLALEARTLLTREVREQLEGVFGCYANGRLDPVEKLPQVQANTELTAVYAQLARYLEAESSARYR